MYVFHLQQATRTSYNEKQLANKRIRGIRLDSHPKKSPPLSRKYSLDFHLIICHEFLSQGETITRRYYKGHFLRVCEKIVRRGE